MMINSLLFESYLECPTKCWLRSRAQPVTGNTYAEWARAKNEAYFHDSLKSLLATLPEDDHEVTSRISKRPEDATRRFAIDVSLRANDVEARLQAVERMPPDGRDRPAKFIPYRFTFSNKVAKNDKLSLAFDALVLSKALDCELSIGKIVHGDTRATLKIALSPLIVEVQKRIKNVAALVADSSPPDLVLNRHCPQCEFEARCRGQAVERDELSLLSGMSEKERRKLRSKGIFTVTQLSHMFRPRRRRWEVRGKKERFHHSLRALAIREKKIHAVDLPGQIFDGTPVYLDVEGLPDRNSYYLIGARVATSAGAIQYTFWADDEGDERRIWTDFLRILSSIPDPQLVHYGSYETAFLRQMCERYGGPQEGSAPAAAVKRAVNLLSFVFARIYFPTFSNGLKDVAGYLGFQWSGSPSSGLEAIVWRHGWEASRDPAAKQALVDYNQQDCEALELVANQLIGLHLAGPQNEVIRTSEMRWEGPYRFGHIAFVLPEMEAINKAAYWDYQRERVYVKSGRKPPRCHVPAAAGRDKPKPNKTISCQAASECPICESKKIYSHGARSKTVIDLRFMRYGIKRWVVRYIVRRQRCQSCGRIFNSSDLRWTPAKYGWDLVAYAVYQNIELRLPQLTVDSSINKFFGLRLPRGWMGRMKTAAAQVYTTTHDKLVKRLCSGRLLHVDETSISVKGVNGYVWVLTSMEEVAYFFTPTREGNVIQELLANFSGVLVSDFYAAYDGISCPQQKCLVHFIRDLNNAILNNPFDEILKKLAQDFAAVVKPIIETVDRRGLRKRYLAKHRKSVDQFYKRLVGGGTGGVADKLIDRLQKNCDRMFTFLDFDGVPWNNNNAEHAVKAFALIRRVIEGHTTEKGLHDILVLLSVCETCKCKNIDFLTFLRSGSKDIDGSLISRSKQRLRGAN